MCACPSLTGPVGVSGEGLAWNGLAVVRGGSSWTPQPRVSILCCGLSRGGGRWRGHWVMELDPEWFWRGEGSPWPWVLSHVCLLASSYQTLCDPVDCSPPGLSVHGGSPGKSTGLGYRGLCRSCFEKLESPLPCRPLQVNWRKHHQPLSSPALTQRSLFLIICFLPIDSVVLFPISHNLCGGNFSQGVCGVEVLFPLWKLASNAAMGIVSTLAPMACLFT